MAQVVVEMTGDEAKLFKSYQKVVAQQVKLEDGMKKTGRAGAEAGKKFEGAGKKGQTAFGPGALGQVAKYAAGLFGVASAVRIVTGAYTQWIEEIQRAGTEAKEFHRTLIQDLSEAGDLMRGAEVEKFVKGIAGVTRAHGVAAWGGVVGAAPGLGFERRKGLAAQAARIGITGQDVRQFAELMGEIAEITPGKTAEDVADFALKLRQAAGSRIGKLASPRFMKGVRILGEAGITTPEKSFAYGLAALQKGITPEILINMLEAVQKPYKPTGEAAFDRFAAATPRERFGMMMMPGASELRRQTMGVMGLKLGQFKPAEIEDWTRQLVEAQTANVLQQEIAAMQGFQAGRQQARTYRLKAKGEKKAGRRVAETLGFAAGRYADLKRETFEADPWYQDVLTRGKIWVGAVSYPVGKAMGAEMGTYHEHVARVALEGGRGFALTESVLRKQGEAADRQIEAADRQTEAAEKTLRSPGGPTLRKPNEDT